EEGEHRVDVGAAAGQGEARVVAGGRAHVYARVDEVDVGGPVDAVGVGGPRVDLDDAADGAPEARREAARVEVDAVQELRVQDRRAAQEMVEEGHAVTVDEDARVVGV